MGLDRNCASAEAENTMSALAVRSERPNMASLQSCLLRMLYSIPSMQSWSRQISELKAGDSGYQTSSKPTVFTRTGATHASFQVLVEPVGQYLDVLIDSLPAVPSPLLD